jgi:hypothetical protein
MRLGAGIRVSACFALLCLVLPAGAQAAEEVEYRLLATNKTSTMQKEMQEAAEAGFHYGGVMGGETAFGGSEVVVVMVKDSTPAAFSYRLLAANKTSTMQTELQDAGDAGYEYRLLATSKTSTMQKELSEAGAAGFGFVGLTVAPTALGGSEVVAILRRAR